MKIRIVALLLAALMMVAVFASCANTTEPADVTTPAETDPDAPVSTTYDPNIEIIYVDTNGYEIDDIPEDLNYGNQDVNILAWSDWTMLEFEPTSDTLSADIVSDAIFKRNLAVESRLGVYLKYTYTPGNADHMSEFMEKIEADTADCTFDFYAGYSRVAPQLALRGRNADLLELDYMNMSKPWWSESLTENFTLGDKLLFCSGDISTNLLWMMEATFYNQSLIDVYELEDPYELVKSDNWTFANFYKLCEKKYSDLTNDGKTDDDTYGLVLYEINIDAYQTSANIFPVKNNDGVLELSGEFTENKIANLIGDLKTFINSDDVIENNSTKIRNIFFEERAVFMTDRVFVIAGKDSSSTQNKIEFKYGVVPNPKFNASQKNYMTNVGHPFTTYAVAGYIPEDRQQRAGAVLECLGSESYRQVTPQVYELAMKAKYASTDENAEMFDLIRSRIVFEPGRLFLIGNSYYTANAFRKAILASANNWVSTYKSNETAVIGALKEINDAFND